MLLPSPASTRGSLVSARSCRWLRLQMEILPGRSWPPSRGAVERSHGDACQKAEQVAMSSAIESVSCPFRFFRVAEDISLR